MPMAVADPAITSFATSSASAQPQLTNAASANPLATSLAGSLLLNAGSSGLPLLNPLLMQPNLSSPSAAGANAGGLGAMPGPGNLNAGDQNVELANALSRLMLGSARQSIALPQQNSLAGMFAANNMFANPLLAAGGLGNLALAGQYQGMVQQSLLNATALQGLLSANSGTSLLSPSDQQQLLINAGMLSMSGQMAMHSGAAGVHSTTTLSGSAPVSQGPSRVSAPAGSQLPTGAGRTPFGHHC